MQLSAKEAWNRILDAARGELPDQSIQSWLAPTEPMTLEGGRLVLGAPDEFAAQWNENKHAQLLTRLASSVPPDQKPIQTSLFSFHSACFK